MNLIKKQLIRILIISQLITSIFLLGKLNAQEAYKNIAMNKNDAPVSNLVKLPTFEFRAYNWNQDLEEISEELTGKHLFGEKVAKKLYLLDKKYTYVETISPGNPQTKTIVKKPVIFNTVKQLERFLKRSVKKGEISVEEAANDFNKVLDVAVNILTADTQKFETTLRSIKDNDTRIELFTTRVNLLY